MPFRTSCSRRANGLMRDLLRIEGETALSTLSLTLQPGLT
jgi:hypothetical protein